MQLDEMSETGQAELGENDEQEKYDLEIIWIDGIMILDTSWMRQIDSIALWAMPTTVIFIMRW